MSALQSILREHRSKFLFALFTAVFMLVIWFAAKRYNFYLFGLPFVVMYFYLAITNFRVLWFVTVFLMPLSITEHKFFGDTAGLTFPTDLLALTILFAILFKMVSERTWLFKFRNHPIPKILGIQILWFIFTAVMSDSPLVSTKYILAYLWLLAAFYFLPLEMFRSKKNIFRFFQLIAVATSIALSIIMFLYVSTGRSPFGLRFNPGPFFLDHTVFGAFNAMMVPIFVLLSFWGDFSKRERFIHRATLLFFASGLFFSYSRAAWAGCVLTLGLIMLVFMSRRLRTVSISFGTVVLMVIAIMWYQGQGKVGSRNKAVSRKSITEHIASITNFRTDYSNAERINRWFCAIEMFRDEPNFGHGPGTYAFIYGNYQKAAYRTPVSTNRGDNGTAHNEWLLAMSETGWPGAVILTALFIVPLVLAAKGFRQAVRKNTKLLYLAVFVGVFCYDVHALVNNFLDQDKVGGMYYALLAILTVLDTYHLPNELEGEKKEEGKEEEFVPGEEVS